MRINKVNSKGGLICAKTHDYQKRGNSDGESEGLDDRKSLTHLPEVNKSNNIFNSIVSSLPQQVQTGWSDIATAMQHRITSPLSHHQTTDRIENAKIFDTTDDSQEGRKEIRKNTSSYLVVRLRHFAQLQQQAILLGSTVPTKTTGWLCCFDVMMMMTVCWWRPDPWEMTRSDRRWNLEVDGLFLDTQHRVSSHTETVKSTESDLSDRTTTIEENQRNH